MSFWRTKEWIELKQFTLKTDKILSRIEYLRLVTAKNYSEDKYREYLKIMLKNEKTLDFAIE